MELSVKKATPKQAAQQEVQNLMRYIRDYYKVAKKPAIRLIRELRLAVRMANHGAGPDKDGPDYCPDLDEAEVLLAVCNLVERNFRLKLSTLDSLSSVSWEEMVPLPKQK